MSIVHLLDTVTEWAKPNICDRIQLKQPPADLDAANDNRFDYELVTPAAFTMYIPTSEKLPPAIRSPYPSLCVGFFTGQDEPAKNGGFVDLQFTFSTWDTGLHGKDLFKPNGDTTYHRFSGSEADAYFKRSAEGWRDAWNFVDVARRAVESVTNIGGFLIDRATPVKFGPLTEQEAIPDLYPYWFAWMTFRVNYPLMRNIEEIQTFL